MQSIIPVYQHPTTPKANYGAGYIGFSFRSDNLASIGIAWFTKEEADKIVVSHAFIVQDETTIIEATGHGGGVNSVPIRDYFNDPHTAVFFKKPVNLTRDRAYTIIRRAVGKIGTSYDYSLFLYFLGHFLFLHYLEKKFPFLNKYPSIFSSPNQWVCSTLVADALNQIEEYSNLVPLSEYHVSKIDPMDLFRSKALFEPWSFEE